MTITHMNITGLCEITFVSLSVEARVVVDRTRGVLGCVGQRCNIHVLRPKQEHVYSNLLSGSIDLNKKVKQSKNLSRCMDDESSNKRRRNPTESCL
jgi:hypothetical protein